MILDNEGSFASLGVDTSSDIGVLRQQFDRASYASLGNIEQEKDIFQVQIFVDSKLL